MTEAAHDTDSGGSSPGFPRILIYALIGAALLYGVVFQLVPRVINARRAYVQAGERNELKWLGVGYHNVHDREGVGPKDLETLRRMTSDWSGDSINPTRAYDWVEAGRIEVVWSGDFRKTMRSGGGGLGEYYIAREVPAEGADDAWVVLAHGSVQRVPVEQLEDIPPLLTSHDE